MMSRSPEVRSNIAEHRASGQRRGEWRRDWFEDVQGPRQGYGSEISPRKYSSNPFLTIFLSTATSSARFNNT